MKFKQQYPLTNDEYGGDKLFVKIPFEKFCFSFFEYHIFILSKVQLLDKDIVMADDIIGSCIVDLN